jgi:hypothetical protein
MAELDLLLDYVSELQSGLERAERHTRAGELAQAMWAYLQVLEVDPDNAVARRQVGLVATAVRQFDRVAPGRRWLRKVRDETGLPVEDDEGSGWPKFVALGMVAVIVAFLLGFFLGSQPTSEEPVPNPNPSPQLTRPNNTLGK